MQVACQCGAVSFTTPAPAPLGLHHCHCTECRKQSASAYGTSAVFPAAGLFPLSADLAAKLGLWTRPANEGRTVDCYFCKDCGVRVMHRIREADGSERETVNIKGGLIEGLEWKGASHIFTKSAVVDIPDGVKTWEGEPEDKPWLKSSD